MDRVESRKVVFFYRDDLEVALINSVATDSLREGWEV